MSGDDFREELVALLRQRLATLREEDPLDYPLTRVLLEAYAVVSAWGEAVIAQAAAQKGDYCGNH